MQVRSPARGIIALATLFPLLAVMACGSDNSTGPDMDDVSGAYDATTFTASALGTDHDLLQSGASIHLVLEADGTTTGRLIVPASDLTGESVDADLAGTWSLKGSTVTLSQDADTFIRDVPLTVDGSQLVGDQTIQGVTIHVILDHQ